VICGLTLLLMPSMQVSAASRTLNPPLVPPGIHSPNHLAGRTQAPSYRARRVCVAWGRKCVKAGQGSRTHPAPCQQYVSVCEKWG
jgi:hypothetical protein